MFYHLVFSVMFDKLFVDYFEIKFKNGEHQTRETEIKLEKIRYIPGIVV